MGIALWSFAGLAAFALGRALPPAHARRAWIAELVAALATALLLGLAATALDFGGWKELEWRAGLFAFFGAVASVGLVRLISTMKTKTMKSLVLALSAATLLSSCAAYRAQHASTTPKAAPAPSASRSETTPEVPATQSPMPDPKLVAAISSQPLAVKQQLLLTEVDRYIDELKADGKYNCCVKPACRQCAITAGECHCREVIDKNGPCCGECTQAWVEGRGNTEGVNREEVLAHLGCVRELYEKKVPEGVVAPAQRKDQE